MALCSSLDDGQLAALHIIGRHRRLQTRQVLVWAGDAATICAVLLSGVLKIVRTNPDGSDHIVGLLFPGDFVGELFVETASETISALSDADLCCYARLPLERLLSAHPVAVHMLQLRALSALNATRKWMLLLGRGSAQEKVAAFLIDMVQRLAPEYAEPVMLNLPMSRSGIGEILGLTIETVSRQMSALQDAGAIALPGGRQVIILDRTRLAALAGL